MPLGTKSLALTLGMFLSFIYALLHFFATPILGIEDLYNIGMNTVFYAVVWTALIFLSQAIWKYMHGLSDKLKSEDVEHLGTKALARTMGIFLAFVYVVMQFFAIPTTGLTELYNMALVTAFFAIVWTFILEIAQIIWVYVHGLVEKIG